jgi:hypothetical protein
VCPLSHSGGTTATREARARLHDLHATLCGGPHLAWPEDVLRVVVTCRESRLGGQGDEDVVFGRHARRVLLPFNDSQVSFGVG